MFRMEKKFERSKNFTEREKSCFLAIVDKYRHIIENKATNAATVAKKDEAWEKVMVKFNASSGSEVVRTTKQLRNLWVNMKRIARSNMADHNNKQDEASVECTTEVCVENSADLQDLIKQIKKDVSDEKEMNGAGGDPFLVDAGTQVCLLGTNTRPLTNRDAAGYCNTDSDNASIAEDSEEDINFVEVNLVESDTELPNCGFVPKYKHEKIQKKKYTARNNLNSTFLKKYYQTKYEASLLEKRTRMVEYKNALKKQAILNYEIKIKKKEYQKLSSSNV